MRKPEGRGGSACLPRRDPGPGCRDRATPPPPRPSGPVCSGPRSGSRDRGTPVSRRRRRGAGGGAGDDLWRESGRKAVAGGSSALCGPEGGGWRRQPRPLSNPRRFRRGGRGGPGAPAGAFPAGARALGGRRSPGRRPPLAKRSCSTTRGEFATAWAGGGQPLPYVFVFVIFLMHRK